jgi:aspartyl-tRNA(Asn)/glutamyl-tRNA(Gln) amidotransferase subunit A
MKMIIEKILRIKNERLSAEQNVNNFLNKIKKDKHNAVLHINDKAISQAREIDKKIKNKRAGKLAGLGVIVKSNINVEGMIVNCASKTLRNYEAGYDATVIKKLKKEDAIILGMANMDEFACGGSGETSAFGVCKNPRSLDRIPGGSSSGSASSVAAELCDFSLGSDTGGSIRNPASHTGVVGFKPSYGSVSRYGLIDLSMSLDVIGPIATNVEDCKIIFNIIKGKDEYDSTSDNYKSQKLNKNIKIGVLKVNADKEIWDLISNRLKLVINKYKCKSEGIKLGHMDLGVQTYYPINYVEFFSGTRKFDGRKYGFVIEDESGVEVLRRIKGGELISQEEYAGTYYRKALRAKKIIENEFKNAFKKYDIIICPTVPKLPHKLGSKISVEDMYNYDTLTTLANLAQIPGISVPAGEINGVPVGIQLLSKKGNDDLLLEVAEKFE